MINNYWQKLSRQFDPVQHFFNGDFWSVTSTKFFEYFKGKVLDLACGTGELVDYINPSKYLGIDQNQQYIDFAIEKRGNKGKFIRADITKIKIRQKFDTITLISAAHHLSNEQIKNMCMTLKKQNFNNLLVIDGIPKQPFTEILQYLDGILGGGKYFRNENHLAKEFGKYFKIVTKGRYYSNRSFYFYPFLIATPSKS